MYGGIYGTKTMSTQIKKAHDAVTSQAKRKVMSRLIEPPFFYDNIPHEMREYRNWLVRKGKTPYSPITHKQGNSPTVCGSFKQAMQALETGLYDGLGFHFDNTPFTGIDLDHHVENEALDELAIQIFIECSSYTEYSPSCTGLHVIVKGDTPQSVKNSPLGFEMYSQGRYFTMTGNIVPNSPTTIIENQLAIQTLYDTFALSPITDTSHTSNTISLTPKYDKRRLTAIIDRIKSSKQGDKFSRLFIHGDTITDYGGDASKADAGLLSILAYWCHDNPQLMHDTFCLSELAKRDKWQHGNTGHNPLYYRELTIRRTLANLAYKRKQEEKIWLDNFHNSFYD